ncbi:hypothetical protein [Schlesneria sp.]|uniref:hypothetical protein n=1 Tax=Schlesneria sp. TaxID=2762018 RepID=UPI002F00E1F9
MPLLEEVEEDEEDELLPMDELLLEERELLLTDGELPEESELRLLDDSELRLLDNSELLEEERLDERGVGLNPMDLLKNLLFTQVAQKDFTKLKNKWKKITAPLEKSKEKPLRFLRYYLMANFKITNKDSIVREDEIYDWFVNKDNAKLCEYDEKPFEFVRKIVRNVEMYLAFSEGQGNDGHANTPMANLKKMCGGAFSLHYVLLLAIANLPKPLFDHFVVQLESFLF